MIRFRLLALMAVLLSIGLIGPAHAVTTYTAQLSGANEASPVDTRARGAAILQLNADGTELKYRLIASNIDDVTMAHIHVGAVGQNGPFVAWLYGPTSDGGAQNGVLATGTITADDLVGSLAGQTLEDLVALIESGDAYVNVHTAAYRVVRSGGRCAEASARLAHRGQCLARLRGAQGPDEPAQHLPAAVDDEHGGRPRDAVVVGQVEAFGHVDLEVGHARLRAGHVAEHPAHRPARCAELGRELDEGGPLAQFRTEVRRRAHVGAGDRARPAVGEPPVRPEGGHQRHDGQHDPQAGHAAALAPSRWPSR